jgi:hypothetical protein
MSRSKKELKRRIHELERQPQIRPLPFEPNWSLIGYPSSRNEEEAARWRSERHAQWHGENPSHLCEYGS